MNMKKISIYGFEIENFNQKDIDVFMKCKNQHNNISNLTSLGILLNLVSIGVYTFIKESNILLMITSLLCFVLSVYLFISNKRLKSKLTNLAQHYYGKDVKFGGVHELVTQIVIILLMINMIMNLGLAVFDYLI